MLKRQFCFLAILFVCMSMPSYSFAESIPADSLLKGVDNQRTSTPKLHYVVYDIGLTRPFDSKLSTGVVQDLNYRIYKKFYMGLSLAYGIQVNYETEKYNSLLKGHLIEFKAGFMSNPFVERGRFSFGIYGYAGYGYFVVSQDYYDPLVPNAEYDPFSDRINHNYLWGNAGLYFRYGRFYLMTELYLSNMDIKPGNHGGRGLFRKPEIGMVALKIGLGI